MSMCASNSAYSSPKDIAEVILLLKNILKSRYLPPSALRVLRGLSRAVNSWRRKRPYPNDYSYQLPLMHHLPETGVILDISSGHNPFPKATILSDRYLEVTSHRREELVLDGRPFVLLDIHALPFESKSVDYIYCSHVIEHIDNPEQACAEMMRVGKAGYIEAPTLMKDQLFGWAKDMSHKWYLVGFGNGILFFEYDERRWQGLRSNRWRDAILSSYYHPFQELFYPNQDIFNTIFEWRDHFDVTVYRHSQAKPSVLSQQ